MKDLLISINSNTLKLSYCGPEGCGGIASDVSKDVLSGSKILDKERFTKDLIELSHEIVPKGKKPDGLSYLISPEDAFVFFVTVNKNDGEKEEQIISGIKDKVEVSLDELYFSYTKIAPFVYQFIGASKDYIEDLLEVSNLWGVPVKAIVPWVLLLPKTLKDNDPAIFVAKINERHVVSLSELNGIYFASSYDEEKDEAELKELVQTLSVYNRKKPIKRIYTLDSDIRLEDGYDTLPVFADTESNFPEGFEVHELYLHVLKTNSDILRSQTNILNLLPLPEPSTASKMVVPAAAAVFVISLLVGSYFLFFNEPPEDPSSVAGIQSDPVNETVISENEVIQEVEENEIEEVQEVQKEDMEIRIENAAGINGAAGRTQALLEGAGYTVVSIDTADNIRETTQILIDEQLDVLRESLEEDLGELYPDVVFDILDEPEVEYNVLIFLGRNIEI